MAYTLIILAFCSKILRYVSCRYKVCIYSEQLINNNNNNNNTANLCGTEVLILIFHFSHSI